MGLRAGLLVHGELLGRRDRPAHVGLQGLLEHVVIQEQLGKTVLLRVHLDHQELLGREALEVGQDKTVLMEFRVVMEWMVRQDLRDQEVNLVLDHQGIQAARQDLQETLDLRDRQDLQETLAEEDNEVPLGRQVIPGQLVHRVMWGRRGLLGLKALHQQLLVRLAQLVILGWQEILVRRVQWETQDRREQQVLVQYCCIRLNGPM